MARFQIRSKEGIIKAEGKPRYMGSYLKPSYIEFSEIASPTPIKWEIGDYVDYSRTGMRYKLYSIPQATKNARSGSHGQSFLYSGVQFHASTKELEIALFKDLVSADNNIHFSTNPDVVTFEDVYGISRRIQACMDYFYPGKWEIRVASFDETEDAVVLENIRTAKDFALSGGTCLDALSKIYELWQDIGWIHSYDTSSNKDIITIGYPNKRITANTTDSFLYGKGRGLTSIKKTQINKDEYATRLYVYGSERNLPARFYNEKNILNAESVDIRHLMIPISEWGVTNGLPDASNAYLENKEAVLRSGVIPKIHYFDSEEAGGDIYPSVEKMTVGKIRKALSELGETQYSPSLSLYPNDTERLDELYSAIPVMDNGVIKPGGKEFEESLWVDMTFNTASASIPQNSVDVITLSPNTPLIDTSIQKKGRGKISVKTIQEAEDGYAVAKTTFVLIGSDLESVEATFTLSDNPSESLRSAKSVKTVPAKQDGGNWIIEMPNLEAEYTALSYIQFRVYLTLEVKVTPKSGSARNISLTSTYAKAQVGYNAILDKTFQINLKQIGFNIADRASTGEGKVISMKSGSCMGRNFVITNCVYEENRDTWRLTCKRQQDDTLGMLFPNSEYSLSAGDRFVLLDMTMPELYVYVNSYRLLEEGEKLLAKASKIQYHYEPAIDAKFMVETGRHLREGMFMEISDEDLISATSEYILIDTLSIYEDESPIPTYKVTLRERRKVTYKGTPSSTSSTNTKSVGEGEEDVEVDLSGYAKESYVDEKTKDLASIKSRLEKAEEITRKFGYDEDGIYTDFNFRTSGELSAGGAGTESGEGGGGTSTGDYKMYHHPQDEAASVWRVEHGLGKFPNVRVLDSNKELCYGDVQYINTSVLTITFGAPFSGDAYCD